jgi:hypothetical protein
VPLQADFSTSVMTGPTHRVKRASILDHDGAIMPLQADFSISVMTGPTHRVKRASILGHDGATVPLQADFSTSVMIISDRCSSSALNAIRDYGVTYLTDTLRRLCPPKHIGGHSFGKTAKNHSKKD